MDTTTYLLRSSENAQRLIESIAELETDNETRTIAPTSNLHGNLQIKIAMKLMQLLNEGEVSANVSIQTSNGVKVADVAWASADFISQHGFETPYSMAPEICVEIIFPGNTKEEMAEKRELYLAKGAKEVWFCEESGEMVFFTYDGRLAASKIYPDFPANIRK
jgi:Uma2 family endonuclease